MHTIRRVAVLVLAALLLVPSIASASTAESAKKGVSAANVDGVTDALADVGASWFYTWDSGPRGITAPSGAEFVPMIWGPGR